MVGQRGRHDRLVERRQEHPEHERGEHRPQRAPVQRGSPAGEWLVGQRDRRLPGTRRTVRPGLIRRPHDERSAWPQRSSEQSARELIADRPHARRVAATSLRGHDEAVRQDGVALRPRDRRPRRSAARPNDSHPPRPQRRSVDPAPPGPPLQAPASTGPGPSPTRHRRPTTRTARRRGRRTPRRSGSASARCVTRSRRPSRQRGLTG